MYLATDFKKKKKKKKNGKLLNEKKNETQANISNHLKKKK